MKEAILFEIIAKFLKVSVDKINIDSVPKDFESWDSLRHMNIILAVEEKFNFEFTEEQIDKLVNVRSFIEFI